METEIYHVAGGKHLYIMRGLPGSGKSTLAESLGGLIFTTDDFFIKDGIYKFDPKRAWIAHQWNIKRSKKALEAGEPIVVIDNTNITAKEIKPYVIGGIECAYGISLVEPDTDYKFDAKILAQKNKHGLGEEKISKMCKRYEYNLSLEKILASK